MSSVPSTPGALRGFVENFARLIDDGADEARILVEGRALLAELIASDDWLPEDYARPHPDYYQQYLLYADPLDRFSLVSFVWGPGQKTPLHDHRTWGLVGSLRGRERETSYVKNAAGGYDALETALLSPGETSAVSPAIGDHHVVANDFDDRVSISIHAYGRNIGLVHRAVYDPASGAEKPFVSGYANAQIPNLWK